MALGLGNIGCDCCGGCTASTLCSGGALPATLDVELQDNSPATGSEATNVYVYSQCAPNFTVDLSVTPIPLASIIECNEPDIDSEVSSDCAALWVYGVPTAEEECTDCVEAYSGGSPQGYYSDMFVACRVWMYLKAGHVWIAAELIHSDGGDVDPPGNNYRVFGQTDLGAAPIDCCGETPWEITLGCHMHTLQESFGGDPTYEAGGCFWNGAGKLVITPVCA